MQGLSHALVLLPPLFFLRDDRVDGVGKENVGSRKKEDDVVIKKNETTTTTTTTTSISVTKQVR